MSRTWRSSWRFSSGISPQGGNQILKGSTLREMHRVQWLRPDWRSGWGLGFSIRRVGDQVRVGHGGSLPGHRTQIEIAPADKLGVIVLTNANDGDPLRYVNQAFTILTPAIQQATGPQEAIHGSRPGLGEVYRHLHLEAFRRSGADTERQTDHDHSGRRQSLGIARAARAGGPAYFPNDQSRG